MPDLGVQSPSTSRARSAAESAFAAASSPATYSSPMSPPPAPTNTDNLHTQSPSHSATHVTLTVADYERLMANEFGVECIVKVNEEKERKLHAKIHEQTNKIEELQNMVKDLNRAAIAEQRRKIELEVQVNAQQSRVDLAVNQNSQMAEMTDRISKELTSQRSENRRLTGELDRFRVKLSNTQTEYSTLQTKFADAKTEINGLRTENATLKAALGKQECDSMDNTGMIKQMQEQNAKLEKKVEDLKKENNDLQKDLIDAVNRLQTAHTHLMVLGAHEAKRRAASRCTSAAAPTPAPMPDASLSTASSPLPRTRKHSHTGPPLLPPRARRRMDSPQL